MGWLIALLLVLMQQEPVIDCLGIPEGEYPQWETLYGVDIWLGYPEDNEVPQWGIEHGFAWGAGTIYRVGRLHWLTSVGLRHVYIFRNEDHEYFVLPFTTLKAFADRNGNHYGIHPCGAFQVSPEDLFELWRSDNG